MKLTATEVKEHARLLDELNGVKAKLEGEIQEFNDAKNQALATLNGIVGEYNSALEECRAFTENVNQRLNDAIADKSDTWQESNKGQAATEFANEWENVDLENLEEFEVEDVDFGADHVESFEGLPQDDEQ